MKTIEAIINQAWQEKEKINESSEGLFVEAIQETISLLDKGEIRVAEKDSKVWTVNEWIKQAVLLSFRISSNQIFNDTFQYYDKVPIKFTNWNAKKFSEAKIRIVPGSIVREGAYLEENVVVMPSFINIGAYIGNNTMIDSYATVGACAQIGSNCHISSNAVIGGVLEPIQASPVIVENNCFIGAGSSVVEGVVIKQGSVIGMGVSLGTSTPIVDRETGKVTYGNIPKYSVVVSGNMPGKHSEIRTQCAVIVKKVDAKTREKVSINELLRP